MGNPRIRGKIAHSEWPKIAARVATGEPLAAVARSYQCTAPAIRYIVRRVPDGRQGASDGPGTGRSRADAASIRTAPDFETFPAASPDLGNAPLNNALWSRVNGDIAVFLSAVDTLISENTVANERALLSATDRLLRATARTRLELEKAMSRHGASLRRAGNDR